jgi:hypothetical protein
MNHSYSPLAEEAATIAVKKVFYLLGVDVDNPSEIERFRQDLRFGGQIRKIVNQGLTAGGVAIIVGLFAAAWAGIRQAVIVLGK